MHPHVALVLWEAGTAVRALGPAGHKRVRPCLKGKGTVVKQATWYLPQAFVCEHTGAQHTCLYTTHTKQGLSVAQTVLEISMKLIVVLNSQQSSHLSFLSGEITGVSYHAQLIDNSYSNCQDQLLMYAGLAMDESPLECFRFSWEPLNVCNSCEWRRQWVCCWVVNGVWFGHLMSLDFSFAVCRIQKWDEMVSKAHPKNSELHNLKIFLNTGVQTRLNSMK